MGGTLVIGIAHTGSETGVRPNAVGRLGITGIGTVLLAIVAPVGDAELLACHCRGRSRGGRQELIQKAAVIGALLVEEEQTRGPLQLVVKAFAIDGQFGLPGLVIRETVFVGIAFKGQATADRGAGIVEGAIGG